MCNLWMCGGVITTISAGIATSAGSTPIALGIGGVYATIALVALGRRAVDYHQRRVVRQAVNGGIDHLVELYASEAAGGILRQPEIERIVGLLPLMSQERIAVIEAQEARDDLLFKDTPPQVRNARRYTNAQRILRENRHLLYVLDPGLLLGTRGGNHLVMSDNLLSCIDGSYKTSVAFAANYRNIVGEDAFRARLSWYQERKQKETGRQLQEPWYSHRADYQAKVNALARRDARQDTF